MVERNLEYLHENRIIYRNIPKDIHDMVETEQYYYYPSGTNVCYTLFQGDHKISSYKALFWNFLVLKYLNPGVDLLHVFKFIADEDNGFIYFKLRELDTMIDDVINSDDTPPVNNIRKVVFKMNSKLTPKEKISLANSLIHRKRITTKVISDAITEIAEKGEKINYKEIADVLGCSVKSISRNIDTKLKNKISDLNNNI
jgi:hypothetical protein